PVSTVDHQHMPVAAAVRAALDWRTHWNGIGARVALVRVVETDGDPRCVAGYDDVGNAERSPSVARAEVRVQTLRETDAGNQRVGVGIDTRGIYRRVPGVVVGQRTPPLKARIDAETRLPRAAGRSRDCGRLARAASREG